MLRQEMESSPMEEFETFAHNKDDIKYFLEYQKCKFGEYCRFSHDIPNNPENMEKIEALEKEVESFKAGNKTYERSL